MSQTLLRVASFNIRNGLAFDGWNCWPFRRRATAEAIARLDADIVGLQEVYRFQLRWLARRLPRYTVISGSGRNGGHRGEMCPLLVRRGSATATSVNTRWYGETPDVPATRLPGSKFPRIATVANLRLEPSGTAVQVFNTHLDAASKTNRARSAAQLSGWLESAMPHIVLGDLNAQLGDDALGILVRQLRPALGPDHGGTVHGFSGRLDGRQIDHVLVSSDWSVDSAKVETFRGGHRLPSDHWPVVANLSLRGD